MRGILSKITGFFSFRAKHRIENIISKLETRQVELYRELPEIKKRVSVLERLYKNKVKILTLAEKPNFRYKTPVGSTRNSLINILETQRDNLRELKDIYDRLAEDLKNFDKIYGEFLSVLKGRGQQDFARLEGLPQVFQEFSRNSSLLDQLTRSAVQMTHSINLYIVEIQDQENIVESSSIELKLTIKRVENVAGERFKLELIRSNYRDSQEKLDQEFVTLKSILSKLKEAKAVYGVNPFKFTVS